MGYPEDTTQNQRRSGEEHSAAKPRAAESKPSPKDPYLRAPNEDDDGYDPYSDRRYEPPLFERDPWY